VTDASEPAQTRTIDEMRAGSVAVAVAVVAALVVPAGCSDSNGSDDLDRIDGPAQVDSDYRPLEEDPASDTTGDDG